MADSTNGVSSSSSSTFSYLSSSSGRFSGLVSGMDIDSIVEKLMKAESAKKERLQQQKQKYEWQRDAYRSVNTKLEAFRTESFDKYGLKSSFLTNKVSNSNESKVSATATSSASGTLEISYAKTATAGTVIGKPTLAADASTPTLSNKTLLKDIGYDFTNGPAKISLSVAQQTGEPKIVEVEITETDTLESFASKINSQNKGVTALVGTDGRFSLTSSATGEFTGGTVKIYDKPADSTANTPAVPGDAGDLFGKLGFVSSTANGLINGTDATFVVNGVKQTSKTNNVTISGYTLQLKENFISPALASQTNTSPGYIDELDRNLPTASAVSISSQTDTDAMIDKVKSFIELYNGLITDLRTQVTQKKNVSYQPLTEAQKAEMKDDEIKKWEDKAKEGLLKGDTSINSALSKMRTAIAQTSIDLGDGNKFSIFSLNIDTNNDGTLRIKNEEKLKKAIEENPQATADLFTQTGNESTGKKPGIVEQLRSTALTAINSIKPTSGKEGDGDETFTLGRSITSVNKQITNWTERLKDIEDRYYKQFTEMEKAINKANSQATIFSQ